jgi:hypothetical protein
MYIVKNTTIVVFLIIYICTNNLFLLFDNTTGMTHLKYVKCSDASAKDFTRKAYIFSRKGIKSVLMMESSRKQSQILKGVPMKYVNFIMIVIIIYGKIWGSS